MASQPVILIGGGGHAGVVLDACTAAGLRVAGVLDDDPGCGLARVLPRLGALGSPIPPGSRAIVAVGDLGARRRVIDAIDPGSIADALVHPSAVVSPSARLGRGAVVFAGAVINRDASVSDHAIVNTRAVIEHDCVVGPNTHIAPGVVLGGGARVRTDTLIGLQSGVLPGVEIGSGCVIGAGAVVTRDVADGGRSVGVPARSIAAPRPITLR